MVTTIMVLRLINDSVADLGQRSMSHRYFQTHGPIASAHHLSGRRLLFYPLNADSMGILLAHTSMSRLPLGSLTHRAPLPPLFEVLCRLPPMEKASLLSRN